MLFSFSLNLQTTCVIYSPSTNWQSIGPKRAKIQRCHFKTDHSRIFDCAVFRNLLHLLLKHSHENNTPQLIDRYSISPGLGCDQAKSLWCQQKNLNQQSNKIVDTEIKLWVLFLRTKHGGMFASINKFLHCNVYHVPNMADVCEITFRTGLRCFNLCLEMMPYLASWRNYF